MCLVEVDWLNWMETVELRQTNLINSSQVGRGEGVAAMVIFSFAGVTYIVTACLCVIIPTLLLNKLSIVAIFTAIGGLFYLIGDNLPPLIREYGEQLSCDQICIDHSESAVLIMLGLAAILYLPIVISGNKGCDDTSLKTPGSVAAILLLAKLTDLDLMYTLIERITSGVCPRESTVTAAWVYYGIFVLAFLGFFLMAINFYMFKRDDSGEDEKPQDVVLANINSVLVCICLAGYLLADNMLPLACTGLLRNDPYYRHVVKLSLWAPTIFIAFIGLLFSCICKTWYSINDSYPVWVWLWLILYNICWFEKLYHLNGWLEKFLSFVVLIKKNFFSNFYHSLLCKAKFVEYLMFNRFWIKIWI